MGYLNLNLYNIKKKNVKLFDSLSEIIKNGSTVKKMQIIKSRTNDDIIEVFNEGEKIRLNSIYNPKREAEIWAKKYEDTEQATSLIMYGYGSGYFFEQVKEKLTDLASIFLYEPDVEVFLFCLDKFDLTEILSYNKIFIYVDGINERDFFYDLCSNISWSMLSKQIICIHTGYDKINRSKYIDFQKNINEYMYALKISENTSIKYSKKFTINIIKNLHFIKESNYLGEFKNILMNKIPVIIVSAGPSLDKNVNELKKAEKKALILATDTAVKTLLKFNIMFDAIVTIDGDKKLDSIDNGCCESKCMFTVPDAKNEFLEKNKGRKIWINGAGYLEKLYSRFGYIFPQYDAGGSVATSAFQIATIMGTNRIILVGQDLAYDGKVTHTGNTIDIYEENGESLYVEGVFGERVKTRYDWIRYLRWFEKAIEQLENKIEVIDATEGGAKINGTKIMNLSEAIKKYCDTQFDFEKFLNDRPVTFTKDQYHRVYQKIQKIDGDFDKIYNYAKSAAEVAEVILTMIKKQEIASRIINTNLKKIMQLREKIEQYDVYILLDQYISGDISERMQNVPKKYNNKIDKIYEETKSYKIIFEAISSAVIELKTIKIDM